MGITPARNLVWKVTSVVFIILTIGASTTAFYYYQQTQTKVSDASSLNTQLQNLQTWLNGNKTVAANYHVQLKTLQDVNASQSAKILDLNAKIIDLQSKVDSLTSQLAGLQAQYAVVLAQNATLTQENKILTDENYALMVIVHSMVLQIGNLTLIVNLQASRVLADKQPFTWTEGATVISIPEATTNYNYSGYIDIKWSSTDSLTFQLSYTLNTNSTIIQSNNSASNDYNIPIIGSLSSPTSATASFQNHNTDCLFHSCAGSGFYTITYWY